MQVLVGFYCESSTSLTKDCGQTETHTATTADNGASIVKPPGQSPSATATRFSTIGTGRRDHRGMPILEQRHISSWKISLTPSQPVMNVSNGSSAVYQRTDETLQNAGQRGPVGFPPREPSNASFHDAKDEELGEVNPPTSYPTERTRRGPDPPGLSSSDSDSSSRESRRGN